MNASGVKVCAVIVCYRPEINALMTLIATASVQANAVLIVINDVRGALQLAPMPEEDVSRLTVLEIGSNGGLGFAQNRGISWAKERGYSHVLLFDQDSQPCPNMVAELLAALSALKRAGLPVAAVGPRPFDRRDGAPMPFVRFGAFGVRRAKFEAGGWAQADFLISSGMLAEIEMFERIGPMDEELFIDNVDLDWCFRARKQGLQLFGIQNAAMSHQIGEIKVVFSLFGRRYSIYRHNPERQYYIMRNRLLLYKRSYSPKAWIVQDLLRALGKNFFILIFFPRRLQNFRMMLAGAIDAARGKAGPYREKHRNIDSATR